MLQKHPWWAGGSRRPYLGSVRASILQGYKLNFDIVSRVDKVEDLRQLTKIVHYKLECSEFIQNAVNLCDEEWFFQEYQACLFPRLSFSKCQGDWESILRIKGSVTLELGQSEF